MTEPNLCPGDLVLFSGLEPIHRLVQKLTRSRWSQVGLVIRLPAYDQLFLLEATSFPLCADVERGTCLPGIRTTHLEPRLITFEGTVAVRRLCPPLDLASIEKLAAFRNSVLGRQFDFSLLASRKSIRRSHTEWDSKSFICSSLVAFAYQSVGVMKRPPDGPLPNNLVPADFSADHNLALTAGYSLDREVNVVCGHIDE